LVFSCGFCFKFLEFLFMVADQTRCYKSVGNWFTILASDLSGICFGNRWFW
jgi:hypothetical protein